MYSLNHGCIFEEHTYLAVKCPKSSKDKNRNTQGKNSFIINFKFFVAQKKNGANRLTVLI